MALHNFNSNRRLKLKATTTDEDDFLIATTGGEKGRTIPAERESYARTFEAVLIQAVGAKGKPCTLCQPVERSPDGHGPFASCIYVKGWFSNVCGNCRYDDYGAQCSLRQEVGESMLIREVRNDQKNKETKEVAADKRGTASPKGRRGYNFRVAKRPKRYSK
ncbi:hypothetical protein NA57DRAFT_54059 [Rhizodiscina lignyota]|uniref:Uncharacterized protein n=1 Tax=Rhizodiscina lignyota TaxID=1504668 RepID=A0A9P4MC69_9PEZI|nr:hypothetical protein NA57DRAFT_54059 [Rhizodiscina lignyota]